MLNDLWAYEAVVDNWPDYNNVVLRPNEEDATVRFFKSRNTFLYGLKYGKAKQSSFHKAKDWQESVGGANIKIRIKSYPLII